MRKKKIELNDDFEWMINSTKMDMDDAKKLRKLERLTQDLSPEGWKVLSAEMDTYSETFMRKYADQLQWHFISIGNRLTEQFIRQMSDYVDWTNISTWKRMTEEFMREFADKINWYMVSRWQKLSWEFIHEFHDKIIWYMLSVNEHIDKDTWKKCKENNYIGDEF